MMVKSISNIYITAIFCSVIVCTFAAERNLWIEQRTKFNIYDNNNSVIFTSTNQEDNLEDALASCWPSKKYAIIVHGFRESCNTPWASTLRENLIDHRGGCIICMDYKDYADDYGFLLRNFKQIAQVLKDKMDELQSMSFQSDAAYLFGFSFGARLVVEAANNFGPQQIGTIHLCEPAGPGFDGAKNSDPRTAAINSQCIHTASGGYGTRERVCHQNWIMGNCGERQVGQRPFPLGNHGLCPVFYNYAFAHVFAAVDKSQACRQPITERDMIDFPDDQIIRMGYHQSAHNASSINDVNLYALTSRDPPFN